MEFCQSGRHLKVIKICPKHSQQGNIRVRCVLPAYADRRYFNNQQMTGPVAGGGVLKRESLNRSPGMATRCHRGLCPVRFHVQKGRGIHVQLGPMHHRLCLRGTE